MIEQNPSGSITINDLEVLLVENEAMAFMERRSDWLSVQPVLARFLGWVPDADFIGGWRDGQKFAAGTMDWNDDTWGRSGPMFDDTTSEGFATIMSAEGLDDVKSLVGSVDLFLAPTRRDQRETKPARCVSRRIHL